jgi:tetratricopeptide (TPR) repeat protein
MANIVRIVGLIVIGLAVAAGPAFAAGGGGGSSAPPPDPNYTKARTLIDAGSYADAIPLLQKVVVAKPKSADAFNYLGYSHRKIGQFDAAIKNYQRALELQPKHLGANEYLGELYWSSTSCRRPRSVSMSSTTPAFSAARNTQS